MTPIHDIVVAVDFEEPSRAALRAASELAKGIGASLAVLHVVMDPSGFLHPEVVYPATVLEAKRTEAMRRLQRWMAEVESPEVAAKAHVVVAGSPAEEIVAWTRATSADLVVVGTHGRRALGRLFLGSVAEHVLRTATCPVLVARA